MKLGDKVWVFDENRREYEKDSRGGPIYAKHFVETTIIGETSKSWIIDYGRWGQSTKYPKKDPKGLFTYEQMQDRIWEHDNRWDIQKAISYCSISQLKEIAKILEDKK